MRTTCKACKSAVLLRDVPLQHVVRPTACERSSRVGRSGQCSCSSSDGTPHATVTRRGLQYACRLTSVGIVGHSTDRLLRRSHDDLEASATSSLKMPAGNDTSVLHSDCTSDAQRPLKRILEPLHLCRFRLYDTEAAEAEDYVMKSLLEQQQSLLDATKLRLYANNMQPRNEQLTIGVDNEAAAGCELGTAVTVVPCIESNMTRVLGPSRRERPSKSNLSRWPAAEGSCGHHAARRLLSQL